MEARRPLSLGRRVAFSALALFLFFVLVEIVLQGLAIVVTPAPPGRSGSTDAGWGLLGLGDSWMAGAESDPGEAFIDVVASLVEERRGVRPGVQNLGVPGTNSAQTWIAAKEYIPQDRPDVVLLITGVNDPMNMAGQDEVDEQLEGITGRRSPLMRLRTVRAGWLLWTNVRSSSVVGAVTTKGYGDPLTTSPWFAYWADRDLSGGLGAVDAALLESPQDLELIGWRALFLVAKGGAQAQREPLREIVDGAEPGPARTLALYTLGLLDWRESRISRASVYFSNLVDEPDSWCRDSGLALWSVDSGRFEVMAKCLTRVLALTPDSPEAWWAIVLMSEGEVPASFLRLIESLPGAHIDTLHLVYAWKLEHPIPGVPPRPGDRDGNDLVALAWAERAGPLSVEAALDLATREDTPMEYRAAAFGLAIRTETDRLHPNINALMDSFTGWPEPALGRLHRLAKRKAPCPDLQREALAAMKGGAFAQEVLSTLNDCMDGESLGDWEDTHAWTEVDGLARIWTAEVEERLLGAARSASSGQDERSQHLNARLDAIQLLAEEVEARLVIVNYPYPSEGHQTANSLMGSWAAANPDAVWVDTRSYLEDQLGEDGLKAMTTPGGHVNAAGYRMMGEAIYEALEEVGALPE